MRVLVSLALLVATCSSPSYASNRPHSPSAPHTPLARRCADCLAENVDGSDAYGMLVAYQADLHTGRARLTPPSVEPSVSRVHLGFWNRPFERAFVRQSDFPTLTAAAKEALERRAKSLTDALLATAAGRVPIVYGPQLVTKGEVGRMLIGFSDDEAWKHLQQAIQRQSKLTWRTFLRSMGGAVGAVASLVGAANLAQGTQGWERMTYIIPAAVVALTLTCYTIGNALRSVRAGEEVERLIQERKLLSSESILGVSRTDGPFYTLNDADDFRRFVQHSIDEWNDLGERDAPRWWHFAGTQGGETVDLLIRSVRDQQDDLEVLAIVRPK